MVEVTELVDEELVSMLVDVMVELADVVALAVLVVEEVGGVVLEVEVDELDVG